MTDFKMPSLGADMEAGKLAQWLVAPGDKVARGDVVAVVETQKGAIEIECFDAGEVAELVAKVGQTLPVGALLARIGSPGAAEAGTVPPAAPAPTGQAAPIPGPEPVFAQAPQPSVEPGAILASPAAKARAAEARVALSEVAGSGPGGAVLLADVDRHIAARPAAPPTAKPGLDMAEMRRAIAAAMTRSKREIPHYYLSHEIDLQTAQDGLAALNATRTPDRRLLMGALLVRAAVRALDKVPELNGRYEAGTAPARSEAVHCGVAVSLRGGGLIAPAILDAATKDTDALMAAMRDLVARARAGRLRMSEITQGTITVSSLGESGVDALFGVIFPPQVALVGFGTPRVRPMIRDGGVAARLAVTVSLAADHRVSDGRRGALFLAEIDRLLQEPLTP
ncbi:MAG: 2-oxo acid dehydrogenase subunit E2 [Rhodobacteraceae bacterium]|jgi:pyruvate dehydrogenase E2 component (dihydrolipoamide acetyltransferase)|uniref:dihydrolipoamide acetyltransferase family protein n=1 Tax=Albidovulum sp. TaxID=1872424 RepID=UPI001D9DC0E4|nr:dihydrolipoamide acetyltransferase family protein [uncultured Defluviimonas sp.]MCB2124024.1 2-oxo acid dehydrogenase subunit E2 [Paracoccaceae bacterium]MCC0071172.1 2-oxo acid dehydrogenase subunit E2 [Paracoccaceae bacterium]